MGVTIRDVASLAGVSISTVSRVLNDSARVDPDKSERVRHAVEELGYTPNPNARSLLSDKTGGIGVILPYITGEFFSALLAGLDSAVQKGGRFLLISTSHSSPAEFQKALNGMYKRVDGLIVMAPRMTTEEVKKLAPGDVPVVFMNTYSSADAKASIAFDNFGGMKQLTEHLLERGHRRIVFVKGDANARDAEERLRGHLAALDEAGIPVDDRLILDGSFTAAGGITGAEQALDMDPLPTAIMTCNDDSALAAMATLRRHGISVPEQMAVTGFDDVPSASYSAPSLTTASLPVHQMGIAAINALVDQLEGENQENTRVTFPVEIKIRESS